MHLSAELNCGISLEVKSLFSQRCDPFSFFGGLIGCRNAVPFETASYWGLVHCSCSVIQYQERAGNKGPGFRQWYSVRAINHHCKLCTAETPLSFWHSRLFWLGKQPSCNSFWVLSPLTTKVSVHVRFIDVILGISSKTSARMLKPPEKIPGFCISSLTYLFNGYDSWIQTVFAGFLMS